MWCKRKQMVLLTLKNVIKIRANVINRRENVKEKQNTFLLTHNKRKANIKIINDKRW